MRITVLAISLAAFLTLGFEWLAVGIHGLGASIGAGHGFEKGASAGAAVAFLYLIGAAFAMGRPLVSSAVFSLAALVGIAAGMWTAVSGLRLWGWLAAALVVLSLLGYRERKTKQLGVRVSEASATSEMRVR
jgi:apolipoprotein N-acyltransferase